MTKAQEEALATWYDIHFDDERLEQARIESIKALKIASEEVTLEDFLEYAEEHFVSDIGEDDDISDSHPKILDLDIEEEDDDILHSPPKILDLDVDDNDEVPTKRLIATMIVDEDGNINCSRCGGSNCWGNYCMDCGSKMEGRKHKYQ